MKTAIIVGNGTSRKNFPLDNVKKETLFLCGMAHTEMQDVSQCDAFHVTVEKYRLDMLMESDDVNVNRIIFPTEAIDVVEHPRYHGRVNDIPFNNSGMFAMKQAIIRGYTNLYILGFDSFITNDDRQSTSNMFEGRPETRARAEDNANRINYLDWFCQHNMFVNFNFVFDKQYDFHEVSADNIRMISYQRFKNEII